MVAVEPASGSRARQVFGIGDIGYARVLCVRITYLGELGYELYDPTNERIKR